MKHIMKSKLVELILLTQILLLFGFTHQTHHPNRYSNSPDMFQQIENYLKHEAKIAQIKKDSNQNKKDTNDLNIVVKNEPGTSSEITIANGYKIHKIYKHGKLIKVFKEKVNTNGNSINISNGDSNGSGSGSNQINRNIIVQENKRNEIKSSNNNNFPRQSINKNEVNVSTKQETVQRKPIIGAKPNEEETKQKEKIDKNNGYKVIVNKEIKHTITPTSSKKKVKKIVQFIPIAMPGASNNISNTKPQIQAVQKIVKIDKTTTKKKIKKTEITTQNNNHIYRHFFTKKTKKKSKKISTKPKSIKKKKEEAKIKKKVKNVSRFFNLFALGARKI